MTSPCETRGSSTDFHRALPDFVAADNVGSPYCVRNYVVDPHLGGPEGLAVARKELARRGLRLMLDFVPNHVAPDHPWVTDHPDYFIKGNYEDSVREPAAFLPAGGNVFFACGKDPFFPAWPDVLQLNAFNPGLRAAIMETVSSIADQCDGVRCDMAMLVMNDIFQRTWGDRAGSRPAGEFWPEVIGAVRASHPGFLFMAEAYWDLEWELQQQGFDFCYDKKLYDRLEHGPAENVRLHLCADLAYQERLVRFIENHDEPRAAATFPPEKARAAAVLATTLPGAVLLHEGQFEGRKVRLPVFLARRPDEPPDPEVRAFYATLLGAIEKEGLRNGEWRLCDRGRVAGQPELPQYRGVELEAGKCPPPRGRQPFGSKIPGKNPAPVERTARVLLVPCRSSRRDGFYQGWLRSPGKRSVCRPGAVAVSSLCVTAEPALSVYDDMETGTAWFAYTLLQAWVSRVERSRNYPE